MDTIYSCKTKLLTYVSGIVGVNSIINDVLTYFEIFWDDIFFKCKLVYSNWNKFLQSYVNCQSKKFIAVSRKANHFGPSNFINVAFYLQTPDLV